MTRELLLELHEGVYCEKVQREQGKKLVDFFKKTLCERFVKLVVMESPPRVKVAVTYAKKELEGNVGEGWVELKVSKQGFYRWQWEFKSQPQVHFNSGEYGGIYGMYRACEDILMSIFPNDFDERDDKGKTKVVTFLHENGSGLVEYVLYLKVEPLT